MARTNFPFYFNHRSVLQRLTPERRGHLVMALLDYAQYGTEPDTLDEITAMAFEAMRFSLDNDLKKYDAKCEHMKEIAARGGKKSAERRIRKEDADRTQPYGCNLNRTQPNATISNPTTSSSSTPTPATTATPSSSPASPPPEPPPAPDGAALPPAEATMRTTEHTPEVFFEQNIGALSGYIQSRLAFYRQQGMDDALLVAAMEQAAAHQARSWSYVEATLHNCLEEGVRTGEAYAARQAARTRAGRGGGRNVIVDRAAPSGNDFLKAAMERPRRMKRKVKNE